jgi:hypothetical protein
VEPHSTNNVVVRKETLSQEICLPFVLDGTIMSVGVTLVELNANPYVTDGLQQKQPGAPDQSSANGARCDTGSQRRREMKTDNGKV